MVMHTLLFSGTNVSYAFEWSDGTVNVTDLMSFTRTFPSPGVYNLTVIASNPLTSKENYTTITSKHTTSLVITIIGRLSLVLSLKVVITLCYLSYYIRW